MGNTGDLGILFRDPFYRIDDHDDHIGTFYSRYGTDNAVTFQFFFDLIFSSKTCGIDKYIFFSVPHHVGIDGITGGSSNI